MGNTLGHWEADLSLALEKEQLDYDVVDCDCGHTVLVEEAYLVGDGILCLSCYEKAKSDWDSKELYSKE